MEPDAVEEGRLRVWLVPFSILFLLAGTIFIVTSLIDAWGGADPWISFRLFFDPNPQSAQEALSSAGEITAAVLAIAITVVAIVVELAANRYTHRITELFVDEPINFCVMGFFVVTALQSLWVSLTFDYDPAIGEGFVPHVGITVSMGMLALCLLILLPYFGFVFAFLNPIQIVDRIRKHTIQQIQSKKRRPIEVKQEEAVRGVEQMADVALNAMENKDKGVSMASVDALYSLLLDYEKIRTNLHDDWFRVKGALAHNPDFVSMSDDVLDTVTGRKIWFEMKVLRQYQTIYNEALNRMRDINYLIAINTRRIAEHAIKSGHEELLDLCLKFFNTYLRATINAQDVRTGYNILNQYRLLAEAALDHRGGARSVEIARYFKYYGLIAYSGGLPFILETAAYDLCRLNELAFDRKSPAAAGLLKIFLEVDKESETEVQEASLRGVRKAQVKLASYYLLRGDEGQARLVYHDMEREKPSRLSSIRDELLAVRSREFWEISDRGVNFDFLSQARKVKLLEFFGWFGDAIPAVKNGTIRTSEIPMVPGDAAPARGLSDRDSVLSLPGVPAPSNDAPLRDEPGE